MTPAPVRDHSPEFTCSRRDLLGHFATGLGGVALATLLGERAVADNRDAANPLAPRAPHFRAKAKNVSMSFYCGRPTRGLSGADAAGA